MTTSYCTANLLHSSEPPRCSLCLHSAKWPSTRHDESLTLVGRVTVTGCWWQHSQARSVLGARTCEGSKLTDELRPLEYAIVVMIFMDFDLWRLQGGATP